MLYTLKGVPPRSSEKPMAAYEPRLTVTWQPRWQAFRESLGAYLSTKAPKNGVPSAYFRDTYVRPYVPGRAMGVSVLSHIAAIFILSLPIWHFMQPHSGLTVPRIELTWTEPAADLPPLSYPGGISQQPGAARAPLRAPSRPSPPGQPNQPLPPSGAAAFHPRQTILSTPQHVTHPRQTLIRPQSSPEPPKLAPQLPNIVEWQGTKSPKVQFRAPSPGAAPRRPKSAAPAGAPPVPTIASTENVPLTIAPSPIVNMQPRLPVPTSATPQLNPQSKAEPVPAPEIGAETSNKNAEPQQLNLNPNNAENVELKMPTSPNATPRSRRRQAASENAAPDLGPSAKESDNRNLIALSTTPAPPAPPPKVPEGNLSARIAISPEGPQPGVPGGAANGPPGATGNRGGGPAAAGGTGSSSGTRPAPAASTAGAVAAAKPPASTAGEAAAAKPPAITAPKTIPGSGSGANSGPGAGGTKPAAGSGGAAGPGTVSISGGAGAGSSATGAGAAEATRPHPAVAKAPEAPKPPPEPVNPVRVQPKLGMDRIDAAATPEQILGSKRVYTIYVNMPNLTSATGSWVLNFAELQTDEQLHADSGDISSPVPVRKVDPKYPPTLRNENVEGEVVLYAIIRRDGSVDSIQLLKGVEPELDQNAMEALARWRFRPATRGGVPVELEAVVHIPFRNTPS